MENKSFNFRVDSEKCIGCGLCIKVCSTAILSFNECGVPEMKPEADGVM